MRGPSSAVSEITVVFLMAWPVSCVPPQRTFIFTFLLTSRVFMPPHDLLARVGQICLEQRQQLEAGPEKVSWKGAPGRVGTAPSSGGCTLIPPLAETTVQSGCLGSPGSRGPRWCQLTVRILSVTGRTGWTLGPKPSIPAEGCGELFQLLPPPVWLRLADEAMGGLWPIRLLGGGWLLVAWPKAPAS